MEQLNDYINENIKNLTYDNTRYLLDIKLKKTANMDVKISFEHKDKKSPYLNDYENFDPNQKNIIKNLANRDVMIHIRSTSVEPRPWDYMFTFYIVVRFDENFDVSVREIELDAGPYVLLDTNDFYKHIMKILDEQKFFKKYVKNDNVMYRIKNKIEYVMNYQ